MPLRGLRNAPRQARMMVSSPPPRRRPRMALYAAFLKAVGKAALNAMGGGFAGDVVCNVLPEVARKVCDWWGAGKPPEERRAEVQALAQAPPAEVREAVDEAVAAVAADQPPEVQKRLTIYLSLVPAAVRA